MKEGEIAGFTMPQQVLRIRLRKTTADSIPVPTPVYSTTKSQEVRMSHGKSINSA
jgi:hypothetical protein